MCRAFDFLGLGAVVLTGCWVGAEVWGFLFLSLCGRFTSHRILVWFPRVAEGGRDCN